MDWLLGFLRVSLLVLTIGIQPNAQAQIFKLPIGSPNEAMNYLATYTDRIEIQVVSIDSSKGDGSVNIKQIAAKETPYSTSEGKLEDFVRRKVTECLKSAINLKDPSLTGLKFGVSCIGFPLEDLAQLDPVLFFAGNNFSLERTSAGNLSIPDSASTIDIAGAVADKALITILASGVRRVLLEIMDETGQVTEAQDSDTHQPGSETVSITSKPRGFQLPLRQILGQSGRITIFYESGSSQIFGLPDGAGQALDGSQSRQLRELRATPAGLESVIDVKLGEVAIIETTPDLGMPWTPVEEIKGSTAVPEKKRLVLPLHASGHGFYRARVRQN